MSQVFLGVIWDGLIYIYWVGFMEIREAVLKLIVTWSLVIWQHYDL